MSDFSVAFKHISAAIEGMLGFLPLQEADKAGIQASVDKAKAAVTPAVDGAISTVEGAAGTGLEAVVQAAAPEANAVVDATIQAAGNAIPVVGGIIAGDLIPLANKLLIAGEGKLEQAIAALFHISGAGSQSLNAATVAVTAGSSVASLPTPASAGRPQP